VRIVVADPDPALFEDVAPQLRLEQHEVEAHPALADLPDRARDAAAHLVLLEPAALPLRRALDLCARLHWETPTLVLVVSRLGLPERLRLLEAGADDELGKPHDPAAVLAHAHALLRRHPQRPTAEPPRLLRVTEEWWLDVGARRLTGPGGQALRGREFHLLFHFLRHEGAVLGRRELLAAVGGPEYAAGFGREVDRYVHHLRQKIEPDPAHPRYLLTRWDEGYEYRGPAGAR
jgi:two-component system KDP operon response regulator KdpE